MKILFNVWSRAGHLNGPLSLAKELAESGHRVAIFCLDDAIKVQARLRSIGAEFIPCITWNAATNGVSEIYRTGGNLNRPPASHYFQLGRRLYDDNWRQKYLEQLFVQKVPAQVRPIREAIQAFAPDIVLNEAVSYSGAIAAEIEGVRWATIASSWGLAVPPSYNDEFAGSIRRIEDSRRRQAQHAGVDLQFLWTQVVSPDLNFTFSWEDLTRPSALTPKNASFIGGRPTPFQSHIKFDWSRLEHSRQVVYISSGTEFEFEQKEAAVMINACTAAGAQVVFASMRNLPLKDINSPDKVVCAPYVPQREILRASSLFISAGGCNSIIDAVTERVPILIHPIGHDQKLNAWFANSAGIGRIHERSIDFASTKRVVSELLDDRALERWRIRNLVRDSVKIESAIRKRWPLGEIETRLQKDHPWRADGGETAVLPKEIIGTRNRMESVL